MRLLATTSQSVNTVDHDFRLFLETSRIQYVPRSNKSLDKILKEHHADGIIVWQKSGPVLYGRDKLFFHPSMAKVRLALYRKKKLPDPMVTAMRLEKDDFVLDCTMGLGSDAIVASYFVPQGRVIALESSPAIAFIVKWGMQRYNSSLSWLDGAIKRVQVVNENYRDYLANQEDKSFDIVYFDPMFRTPLLKSQAIEPLRQFANHFPVDVDSVNEAVRVARKRVVMKEMPSSGEFSRLGFEQISGSPGNPIAYGIIDV